MESVEEEIKRLLSYDPETGIISWIVPRNGVRLSKIAGHERNKLAANANGYIRIMVNWKSYYAHRLAWLIYYWDWPEGQIDHIDGDRRNNKISNLRDVSPAQNAQNNRKANSNRELTSSHLGVSFHKKTGKWLAAIKANGKLFPLGYFDDEQLAANAYMEAKKVHHTLSPDGMPLAIDYRTGYYD
jgi:hypothetical protein